MSLKSPHFEIVLYSDIRKAETPPVGEAEAQE